MPLGPRIDTGGGSGGSSSGGSSNGGGPDTGDTDDGSDWERESTPNYTSGSDGGSSSGPDHRDVDDDPDPDSDWERRSTPNYTNDGEQNAPHADVPDGVSMGEPFSEGGGGDPDVGTRWEDDDTAPEGSPENPIDPVDNPERYGYESTMAYWEAIGAGPFADTRDITQNDSTDPNTPSDTNEPNDPPPDPEEEADKAKSWLEENSDWIGPLGTVVTVASLGYTVLKN